MRAEVSGVRSDVAEVKFDTHPLRADVTADILTTRKELAEQIVGLRRGGVRLPHLGHRPRRDHQRARGAHAPVGQHLNLPFLS